LPSKPTTDSSTLTRRLSNGLKLIVRRDAASPVVSLWAFVSIGGVNEDDTTAGISHVLEHMAFKGTPTRGVGEISRQVERLGGEINAFTSYHATAYYLNLPKRQLNFGVELLADVLTNSIFDEAEIQKELQVIREEIRMRDDQPETRLWELLASLTFQKHRLGCSIAGTHESVNGFTRRQLVEFWKRYYTPQNTRIVVVGDVEPKAVLAELEQQFAAYDGAYTAPTQSPAEPPQTAPRQNILRMPVHRAHLAVGWPTVGKLHADAPALDLLAAILGEGLSCRLYRRVKDELDLLDDVVAYTFDGDDNGLFVIDAELPAENVEEAIRAVLAEVVLLRKQLVDDHELARMHHSVELSWLEEQETAGEQAYTLAWYDHLGDWQGSKEYLRRLQAVQPEELRDVAQRYLSNDSLNLALILPEEAEAPELKLTVEVPDTVPPPKIKTPIEPPPSIFVPSPVQVEELTLPNGVRLVLRQNPARPQCSVVSSITAGLCEEPAGKEGIGGFALEMSLRGTELHDAPEFHAATEFYGIELTSYRSSDLFGIWYNGIARHLSATLGLFTETLLRPAFPEKRLQAKREDILAGIASRSENAAGYAFGLVNNALFNETGYGRFLSGTTESITALGRDRLADWYKERVAGKRLMIGVSGRFQREQLLDELTRHFGGLPPGESAPKPPAPEYRAKRVELELPKRQTHLALAFPAPNLNSTDRFAAAVLSGVLGGSGNRLFRELRDKRHLAYQVFFAYRPFLGGGSFIAYLGTQPGRGDEAEAALLGELSKANRDGFTEEEINDTRQHLIGLYQLSRQRGSAVLSQYVGALATGRSLKDVELYPERIAAITTEQVNALANRLLQPELAACTIIRGTLTN